MAEVKNIPSPLEMRNGVQIDKKFSTELLSAARKIELKGKTYQDKFNDAKGEKHGILNKLSTNIYSEVTVTMAEQTSVSWDTFTNHIQLEWNDTHRGLNTSYILLSNETTTPGSQPNYETKGGPGYKPTDSNYEIPSCNATDFLLWNLENFPFENCSNLTNLTSLDNDQIYGHPALGVLLSLFAIVTVFGNLLVMIAVAKERYLRHVTNYFIVSLAIADTVIGAVVMPFSIVLEMTNQMWIFGGDWCDIWHSFDVLASTASILNLSVISLDRYWAITDPISYPCKMSTGKAMVLIALVWIASAAISFPAILYWRAVSSDPTMPHICMFTEDTLYLVLSSIVSFYGPVTIIMFAYYKIYKAASEQIRSFKTGTKVLSSNGQAGEVMTLRIHRGGGHRYGDDGCHYSRAANSDSENDSPAHLMSHHHDSDTNDIRPSRMISRKWNHFAISRKISKIAKEQKAAKTLGIVMGVFCMCWVPFFVCNVLYAFCKLDCVEHAAIVFPVFTWLGYINSGMNPIIYALSMRDFRRAFYKILVSCCPKIHFRSRSKNYFDSALTSTSYSNDRYTPCATTVQL